MEVKEADALARKLMRVFGLGDWRLTWDNSKRRAGTCLRGGDRIVLSKPVVECNDEGGVKEIVLHEIAHALTNGGHGPQWSAVAKSIGCSGSTRPAIQWPRGQWVLICERCEKTWTRFRRPAEGRRVACKACGQRAGSRGFDERFVLRVRLLVLVASLAAAPSLLLPAGEDPSIRLAEITARQYAAALSFYLPVVVEIRPGALLPTELGMTTRRPDDEGGGCKIYLAERAVRPMQDYVIAHEVCHCVLDYDVLEEFGYRREAVTKGGPLHRQMEERAMRCEDWFMRRDRLGSVPEEFRRERHGMDRLQ